MAAAAALLAKNWRKPWDSLYDNELITMAAEKTGLSVECFKDAEKNLCRQSVFSLTSLTPSIDSVGLPLNEKIFLVQSQVIKEVAEEGPV